MLRSEIETFEERLVRLAVASHGSRVNRLLGLKVLQPSFRENPNDGIHGRDKGSEGARS